jgi:hypothetical protein
MGFLEIGRAVLYEGLKTVRYLGKKLVESPSGAALQESLPVPNLPEMRVNWRYGGDTTQEISYGYGRFRA